MFSQAIDELFRHRPHSRCFGLDSDPSIISLHLTLQAHLTSTLLLHNVLAKKAARDWYIKLRRQLANVTGFGFEGTLVREWRVTVLLAWKRTGLTLVKTQISFMTFHASINIMRSPCF